MYLPPIEERATDTNTSLLQVHISPAGEGPLEGVGFLRKDAAAQDGGAWTRRGDTVWGEVSVASRTGAEAGHSAARGWAGRAVRECKMPTTVYGARRMLAVGLLRELHRAWPVEVEDKLPLSFGTGTQDVVRGLYSRYPWTPSSNTGLCAQKWFSAKY